MVLHDDTPHSSEGDHRASNRQTLNLGPLADCSCGSKHARHNHRGTE